MLRPTLILVTAFGLVACDVPSGGSGSGASTGASTGAAPVTSAGRAAVSEAEQNCVSAGIAQSGVPTVSVISSAPGAGGTLVTLRIPGEDAAWTCLTDADGIAIEVQGLPV